MLNDAYTNEPSKKVILKNKDDFDEVVKRSEVKPYILNMHEPSFTILLRPDFNDAVCPKCGCRTISPVLDVESNKLIDNCVHCGLQYSMTINQ